MDRDLTSLRQSAEWGMGAFKRAFPRLSSRMRWEEDGFRKCVLVTAVHLINLRTRQVGLSQIKTVWEPYLEDTNWLDELTQ